MYERKTKVSGKVKEIYSRDGYIKRYRKLEKYKKELIEKFEKIYEEYDN